MSKGYSAVFIGIITIAYVGLFTTTLLNMIFSVKATIKDKKEKNEDAFKYVPFPEKKEKINQTLIMNLEFGEDIPFEDYYGEIYNETIYRWRGVSMKKIKKTFEIEFLN